MSDVEENNFEGRVSTKPREPSSAAARCSGARGRARSVGRGCGARRSSLEGHRERVTSQDGFGVPPACPDAPLARSAPFWRLTGTWPGPILSCRSLSSQLPISAPRCGSPARWGRRRRGAPSGRIVVGASCGGISGHPPPPPPAIAAGSRGRKCAGLLSGRGLAGAGLAGACVSLALCCSERPRLRRNRRRCVYRGESLEVEGGTSPVKWLVNGCGDP